MNMIMIDDFEFNIQGNKVFETHRKEHYNEFKMAQLLKSQLVDDDDEDDDADNEDN